MIDFTPVLARLKETCSDPFVEIESAVDVPDAIERIGRMPGLYLLEATLSGTKQKASAGFHVQNITETFDLVYVLPVKGAVKTSSARSRALKSFKTRHTDPVWAAIVGWTWSPYITPISVVSGRPISLDTDRMIFSERFETSSEYRVERSHLYS